MQYMFLGRGVELYGNDSRGAFLFEREATDVCKREEV